MSEIGFVSNVLNGYFHNYFPRAANVSLKLRDEGYEEGFTYTSHPWLVSLYLNCSSNSSIARCKSPGTCAWSMFGLSNERPILGDNPKAHNENHCGFHEKWWFLWKAVVFMKSIAVFTWKVKSTMKSTQKQLVQHRSLIWTWCFIEYRGKGQLGISYILVVFGGAHVFGGTCMSIWCTYMYL